MKQYIFPMIIAITLVACSTTTDLNKTDYIGLNAKQAEQKAESEDVSFRVTMIDGKPQPVTLDYRPGRINAVIENGIITAYEVEGEENLKGMDTMKDVKSPKLETYNQDSWKLMIPETCTSYFDGCNQCNRNTESDTTACTRKFCETYEEPRCTDEE